MRFLVLFLAITVGATACAGDVVEMSARVTGNQEQTKMLYIVPWHAAESSDALSQSFPPPSLDSLEPAPRDAFQCELLLRQLFKQVSGNKQ